MSGAAVQTLLWDRGGPLWDQMVAGLRRDILHSLACQFGELDLGQETCPGCGARLRCLVMPLVVVAWCDRPCGYYEQWAAREFAREEDDEPEVDE